LLGCVGLRRWLLGFVGLRRWLLGFGLLRLPWSQALLWLVGPSACCSLLWLPRQQLQWWWLQRRLLGFGLQRRRLLGRLQCPGC